MIFQKKSSKIEDAFRRIKGRLEIPLTTKPALLFLPIGLMCILLIYVSFETNPRLSSRAKPIDIAMAPKPSSQLWYSIFPIKAGLRITSNNGEVFDISTTPSHEELSAFRFHLKERVSRVIADVAVARRMDRESAYVILSVDERLTYGHIRPMIFALAEAGVSRYGFEGRVIQN